MGPVFANGVSEFVSEIFHPLASVMYNYRLMRLVGLNGVAAYGVLMNVGFLFGAVFLGFAVGCAPIFSYQYEVKSFRELHKTFKKCAVFVVVMGFVLYGIALCIEGPFAKLFFGNDEALLHMTEEGFSLHSKSYMVMGLAVFTSAFFTAIHNSKISALISFLRTLHEVFDSIGFETSKSFSEAAIKAALEELDSGDFGMILRAKGILAGEDGNWIHFDYVPGEADVRTGAADVTGKLCVIGSKVDKEAVKVLFGL